MPLSEDQRQWYYDQIQTIDPDHKVVSLDKENRMLTYSASIQSDENRQKDASDEELVRALILCMLVSDNFKYSINNLYIEKYFEHGSTSISGHGRDEVDLIIYNDIDNLPFAMWELKSAEEFDKLLDRSIRFQLFGTSPLVGAPKLLVYATIRPVGTTPTITLICIDRTKYASFESWDKDGRPSTTTFPESYTDPAYIPYTVGGKVDLRLDCTQADFRAVAATFHSEFFSEHPDTVLFANLVKCLLAKIFDERLKRRGEKYDFQIFYEKGREEAAAEVFDRINRELYNPAYKRYIDPGASDDELDEINPKEFPPEKVKIVVRTLQGMSITKGAALHGDIVGTFFEEILRAGFKQDAGMYFTHSNLVYFMLEALDLEGLAVEIWKKSNHPDNRLPYIIDPACGSGAFLLRAMQIITKAIRSRKDKIVADFESELYYNTRLSDIQPNGWADNFIYGMDPKFVMAITAKVNMVLHGDGSAHIYKYDALKPFTSYGDDRLKPLGDPYRTIPRERYDFDVCERFDVVVSNPPFGITVASDTRTALPQTFSISSSSSSETLFFERWFQLLKPNGRLGVVVPESLLNTAESTEARLFLYRTFWIRAIVALPRNIFIETPTLTSLLFAQKKTKDEIADWDKAWNSTWVWCERKKTNAEIFLRDTKKGEVKIEDIEEGGLKKSVKRKYYMDPLDIQQKFINILSPIITEKTSVVKKGGGPLTVTLPADIETAEEACKHYLDMLKLASFDQLIRNYIFGELCNTFNYEYPVYLVEEVGYKLSKRKERLRPNQLCHFISSESKLELPNLNLADEPFELVIDLANPERVIDYIRKDVKWV